jgi:hypothetical protein
MKIKDLVCLLAIFSLAVTSCNSKKDESRTIDAAQTPVAEVAKQAVTEGTSVTVEAASVPEPIRTSFTTKYPKAQKVVWVSYTPVESDDLEMDDQYYYVRYNNDGADYTSWYNNRGEWVKTSTKVPGNSKLPDAVNKTINASYPGYTIVEIDKENDKDMEMYEIELNKGESKVKLKILPNGEVFKRKRK